MKSMNIRKYRHNDDWKRLMSIHDRARRLKLAMADLDESLFPWSRLRKMKGFLIILYTLHVWVNVL